MLIGFASGEFFLGLTKDLYELIMMFLFEIYDFSYSMIWVE